ncbi:MAG: DUF4258 domain-containing protein [Candidatus Acidiferrales bacterium]
MLRYSRDDAAKLIRECVETGRIRITQHFKQELMKEGLSIGDALHVIQHGGIYNEPEHDPSFQQWRYRIEGTEPDGKYVGVIFAFETDEDGVLITVFEIESR